MSAGAEQEGSLAFVDTNVLVYSVDDSEPRRRMQAVELLRSLVSTEALCTSTQVLGEFFVTVTRKIQVPISASKAL